MKKVCVLVLAVLLGESAARGEVVRKSPYSFQIEHKVTSKAVPADLYSALARVERWWNGQHTFSGQASALSLEMNAGGCFCERWRDGSVEHGQVVQVAKDRLLRLRATLGPLLELPVSGVLTFSLTPKDAGTELKVSYLVSGDMTLPVRKWADPSDKVLAEQIGRLVRFAESGRPQ